MNQDIENRQRRLPVGMYTPIGIMGLKMRPGFRLDDDGLLEKQCTKCEEWWPADSEFFPRNGLILSSWCSCCHAERRNKGGR